MSFKAPSGPNHPGIPREAVPGEAAGITDPALLLLVVAAAVLAGVEVAVQALPFAVQQELEGLQAVHTVGFIEVGLIRQELPLAALLVDLALQLPVENTPPQKKSRKLSLLLSHCKPSHGKAHHTTIISGMIFQGALQVCSLWKQL